MKTQEILLPIGEYVIRSFCPEDIDSLVRHANNRNVWLNLRDLFPHPYERHHAEAWLRDLQQMNPVTAFAIASSEELIGGIGLHPQPDVMRRSVELGYWLAEPYWGRGIATAAVRAMVEWGFSNLDINRIFAYVFGWNLASARVLEKAGFTLEGRMREAVFKDGRLTDLFVYGMVREAAP
jgi:RimJ/RimL family protein N-acetyltransferase